ncbi:hypothetical protein SPONN_2204 [uncultured Candidatus Thioglobus sp.]|nr:hypothetical protein SPONN_2204 [uncultured Candidatus Thioglobus sp.]
MKKLLLSIILLSGFSTAQALEFKGFNFNDESACADKLGQLTVVLPRGLINPNQLAESQEICLQAYIGDNACQQEYNRQEASLGLTSGIRSNHSAEAEKQAQQQCGGWLKQRRSACESFLQQASSVCYQLTSKAENQQQKQAEELADNLLGTWKGNFGAYGGGLEGNYQMTLNINRKISDTQFSGIAYITAPNGSTAKQRMDINVYDGIAYLKGTVLSNDSGKWKADNFELSINDGVMRGTMQSPGYGAGGNAVLRKQ